MAGEPANIGSQKCSAALFPYLACRASRLACPRLACPRLTLAGRLACHRVARSRIGCAHSDGYSHLRPVRGVVRVTSVLAQIDDDLTLRVPQYFCCNCGDAENIKAVSTPLRRGGPLRPGARFAIQLELPYCERCTRTAIRPPVGLITKTLIAVILSASAGMVAMITPLTSVIGAWAFYLVAVPVCAMVFAAYAVQKAKGKQTSYEQPVRIVELTHRGSGNVAALTLSFTHARYAQAFANANKDEVARGVLVVEEG